MVLKTIHDTLEEIPEPFRELYTEKSGKFELTGIQGVRTPADVDRLNESLRKEREAHKETKAKLSTWGDLDHDEVVAKLDRIPELEAAAKGKLNEEEIEAIVERRVEGTLRSKIAPLERQISGLEKERDEVRTERDALKSDVTVRNLRDHLRPLMREAKVIAEHDEDVFLYAERALVPNEDGNGWTVKEDAVGVTPGASAKDWLVEMIDKRPGWLPPSQGGGAGGSGKGGGGLGGPNPWSAESWNMTRQGEVLREKGRDHAERLAKQAGTTIGGGKPAPRQASRT